MRLLRILTYSYSARDTLINTTVLALQVSLLSVATSAGRLSLGSLFWLPFSAFACTLQVLTCIVTEDEGFSMVWCALVGLGLYERSDGAFSAGVAPSLPALASVSHALAAAALAYYAAEEVLIARAHTSVDERGPAPQAIIDGRGLGGCWGSCWAGCWLWCGATCMHLLGVALGAALVALADGDQERRAGFWVLLSLGAALLLLLPLVCRCRPPSARVVPEGPLSAQVLRIQVLRIHGLQLQLARCQEQIALLRAERDAMAAASASPRAQISGEGDAAQPCDVADDGAGAGAAASRLIEISSELTVLERREAQLWARVEDATASACDAMPPAAAVASSRSTRLPAMVPATVEAAACAAPSVTPEANASSARGSARSERDRPASDSDATFNGSAVKPWESLPTRTRVQMQ